MSQVLGRQAIAGIQAGTAKTRRLDPERRISVIWLLLFFNGLPFRSASILPLPQRIAQLLSAASLGIALLLALQLNPRLIIRPNVVLALATLLVATALMTSIRGTAGIGGVFRCLRLGAFLTTLWLLTPWWGRRLLARSHLRALIAVLASVIIGAVVAPSVALSPRLRGVIWPIPAPQVGELAALAAGFGILGWLSGSMSRARGLGLATGGVLMVLLSHTRTALVGLLVGLVCAGGSLFLSNRRVRRAAMVMVLAAPVVAVGFAPALSSWFTREQSVEELRGLTGRTQVWVALMSESRSEFTQWFGIGLGDKSFDGRPIDSTWLAVYHEQGLIGVAVVGALLIFLLVAAGLSRAAPARALGIFIVVYCICASYTEAGLGDATPYLLHIVVAASLVATTTEEPLPPLRFRRT